MQEPYCGSKVTQMTALEQLQQDHEIALDDAGSLAYYLRLYTCKKTEKAVEKIFFELWDKVPPSRIIGTLYLSVGSVVFRAVAEYNRRATFRKLGWGLTPCQLGHYEFK